jgi:Lipocalin-like domain
VSRAQRSSVIPGRRAAPGPESITTDGVYGFRPSRFALDRNDEFDVSISMRVFCLILTLTVLGPLTMQSASAQSPSQSEVAQRLAGAWRYVGTWIDGKPRPGRGDNPKGMIVYTAGGHMTVQIAPDRERKKAGREPTPEEAKFALENYVAYFGTYTIDERAGTLTHHRWASIQPGDRTEVVRAYEFVGDRLILRPPDTTQEIVWERIK